MQVLDSFIDAALSLSKTREGDELIGMIVRYLRTGAEPSPRTETQRAVLIAIMPSMVNSKARIDAGRVGGSKTPSKRASKSVSKTPSKRASEEEEEEEIDTSNTKQGESSSRPTASAERTRFVRPSLDEVRAYIAEKGLDVDAERFIDYYTANGWKAGRVPMKDWKATVRNWARGNGERKKGGAGRYAEYD